MIKKALDEKYFYQIDEHNVVHLFRGEEDCQQYLTNPLLSAIFKIETLEKENAELKKELVEKGQLLDLTEREWAKDMSKMIHYKTQSTKAKEYIKLLLMDCVGVYESTGKTIAEIQAEADQFLKDSEE
jgi:hypothetical protein